MDPELLGAETRAALPSENPAALLAEFYAADRREHGAVPPVGTPEYQALRERDRTRRAHAAIALAALRARGTPSASDLFHAAWLFNHGDDPEEALSR